MSGSLVGAGRVAPGSDMGFGIQSEPLFDGRRQKGVRSEWHGDNRIDTTGLSKVTEVVYGSGGPQSDEYRYFYDLLGSLDAELASNGLHKDYVYDNMQRLRKLTHYRTDGTLADIADLSDDPRVVRFDYTVRADGRRTAANEYWYTAGSATQTSPLQASYQFTYDNLGRLTDEVFDHWDSSLDYRDRFAYDPAGNRVEKSRDAGRDGSIDTRTAYRFDVNDRLIDELAYGRTSDPESRTSYTYAHTQNTGSTRTSSTSNFTLHTSNFSYDLQGRLFTATVTNYNDAGTASSITRSTYDYDHTGIRVSAVNEIDSTADGTFETRTKIEYLVDHSNHTGYQQVIRESHYDVTTGKHVKTVDYTFGHDEISQTVVTYNAAGIEASRDKQWFLHDGKANVRGLLDAASAILTIAGIEQIYFYDAYGSLLNLQASQAATTLLYNGEMFDTLTGNQYLRARYYNPANAQFNRLDPFFGNQQDPQSFNKYSYVHSDPINSTDPLGLWTVSGVLTGVTIGATLGSIAAPVLAVAYLSVRGRISPFEVWNRLWTTETWMGATSAILGGAAVSAGLSALVLQLGKKTAERITPGLGAVMALYGLKESIVASWNLATEELPPKEAEQFVATMLATTFLSVAIGKKLQKMGQTGKGNDESFWQLTPELRNQYNVGRQLVPTRVWKKFELLGIAGDHVGDAVSRGAFLQNSYGRARRMLFAAEGLAETLKNQVTNPFSSSPGITTYQWLSTGLTPDFRWVFSGNNRYIVGSSIVTSFLHLDDLEDWLGDLF